MRRPAASLCAACLVLLPLTYDLSPSLLQPRCRRLSVTGFASALTAHFPPSAAKYPRLRQTKRVPPAAPHVRAGGGADEYRSVRPAVSGTKTANVVVKGGGSEPSSGGNLEERGRLTSELVAPIMEKLPRLPLPQSCRL